ncbi:MAG: hypothetical protein V3U82_03380 [Robiginitomaculum sp.]
MILITIIGLLLAVAAIAAVIALIGYRALGPAARRDYAYKSKHNILGDPVDEAGYVRAYGRYHAPRRAAYIAGTLVLMALLTAPFLAFLTFMFEYSWRLGGQERAYEPGYLVWQFMLFGAVIAGWALVAFLGARRYYKFLPTSLDVEIAKEFKPDFIS